MDALTIVITIGVVAVTIAAVVLLNRVGTTPRIPYRRIVLFVVVSLGSGFVVSTLLAFAALQAITHTVYPGDAGEDLRSALGVGAGIALVLGGAGVVGCVLAGSLAARWTRTLGLRFLAAATGGLAGTGLVIALSGTSFAGVLVPIVGLALAAGAVAPWGPGFLRTGRTPAHPDAMEAGVLAGALDPPD